MLYLFRSLVVILALFLNSSFIIIFLTYLCWQKMFFYRNFTIANILRFKIVLISIYFVKLFRATTRSILTNVFVIDI